MRRYFTAVLAAGLIVNGLAMLLAPLAWYGAIPSVAHTGPLNSHFVRDVGCAYLASGGALLWMAWSPAVAWPAAMAAAGFLGGHALVHVWDTLAGRAPWAHLLGDLPGVILVPALVLWLSAAAARRAAAATDAVTAWRSA